MREVVSTLFPGEQLTNQNTRFLDISATDKNAPFIEFALEQGAISLPDHRLFVPDRAVTRAEALKVILTLLEIETEAENTAIPFLDIKEEMWFAPYIQTATTLCLHRSERIVFLPHQPLTELKMEDWLLAANSIQQYGTVCEQDIVEVEEQTQAEITPVPERDYANVSLAPGFFPPGAIPRNASNVRFLEIAISAPTTEAVGLEGITIRRKGLGSEKDFIGVKVLVDGARYGSRRSFADDHIAELNISYEPVEIAAGETRNIVIAADMDAESGDGNHQLVIENTDSILLIGKESGEPIAIQGQFPISSNMIGAVNSITAELNVEFEPTRAPLYYVRKRADVARIKISEISGEESAIIESMVLSFDGIDDGGLKNLFVEINDELVSNVVDTTVDRKATFVFLNGGIVIDSGDDTRLRVRADIYVIDDDFQVYFENLLSDLRTRDARN